MMAGKPSPRSNYHLIRIIINRPPEQICPAQVDLPDLGII